MYQMPVYVDYNNEKSVQDFVYKSDITNFDQINVESVKKASEALSEI